MKKKITKRVHKAPDLKGQVFPKSLRRAEPGLVFLDSGAFTLWTKQGMGKGNYHKKKWFRHYVDSYAKFVLANLHCFDYYATVDVIRNPEATYEVQKILENDYGLKPVPVYHFGSDKKWIHKYIDEGYDFIGIGGRGKTRTSQYIKGMDPIFKIICPKSNDFLPIVRTHGFAVTTHRLLLRYPWWSVDSTSWVIQPGFGSICIPKKGTDGEFDFLKSPNIVYFSDESPQQEKSGGRHYKTFTPIRKKDVQDWLKKIDVPLGEKKGWWGVISARSARVVANLRYFEELTKHLPDYPWRFNPADYQDQSKDNISKAERTFARFPKV